METIGGSYTFIVRKTDGEEEELFVRIETDKSLTLTGDRSVKHRVYFTARECEAGNFGKVTFPKGKTIDNLVEGDKIIVTKADGSPGSFNGVPYLRRR